ncbi:hypothetical protein [uncultured Sphingomonas sp.]|uniref:hypothetical protein n=1 Tax=uncultured Sphingomonas sp. TaxID=158754 RepID=UPI0035C945AD
MIPAVATLPAARAQSTRDGASRDLLGWPVAMLLAIIALGQQAHLGLDCDVSWLLTVGERVLDGSRLYRDVIEVNPPASVLIYLPAILIGRWTDIGADRATMAAVALLAAAMVAVSGRILTRAGLIAEPKVSTLMAAAMAVFLLLPGACFAQREHVAVLLALPALAAIACRAAAMPVPRQAALLAGVAGGLAIAIKPHFALAFLLPIGVAAVRRRSIVAVLGPESAAAAVIVAGYVAVVLIVFPDYLAMLPLLRAVYLPLREDPITLMRGPVVALPVALAALAWWLRGARVGIVPAVLGAAASGFVIAGVVQGKGYLNHAYPAAALGFLALGVLLSDDGPFRQSRAVGLAAIVMLAMLEWHAFSSVAGHPGLAEAVAQVAPPHPRMIALSDEIGVGHPLVRQVAGRWVGRSGALWATGGVATRIASGAVVPDERQRLDAIAEAEAGAFMADVRQGRPDVLLIDATLGDWRRRPPVAAVLGDYRPATRVGDVELWTRRPGAATAPPRPRHASDRAFIATRYASPAATARAAATAWASKASDRWR